MLAVLLLVYGMEYVAQKCAAVRPPACRCFHAENMIKLSRSQRGVRSVYYCVVLCSERAFVSGARLGPSCAPFPVVLQPLRLRVRFRNHWGHLHGTCKSRLCTYPRGAIVRLDNMGFHACHCCLFDSSLGAFARQTHTRFEVGCRLLY